MCGDRDTPLTLSALAGDGTDAPVIKYLKDYKKPTYLVDNIQLDFNLDNVGLDTIVRSKLTMLADCAKGTPLVLDGEMLELLHGSLKVGGVVVPEHLFSVTDDALTIDAGALPTTPGPFLVETAVRIKPAENTALSGLYMSTTNYCTQCEAEGFRRITYFPDRPDVMAKYNVRITAPKSSFPVLLSNGNCVASGVVADNPSLHWAEYEDPFKKPCYLFALVVGDLVFVEDKFTTMNGRNVTLRIYVKGEGELLKCAHAMESLKNAMKWDEEVYGLEYDLDIYNVVAVPDFNMGAMENKSLNIFNSKYILASKETATDADFNNVEGVVGHEYFHNYTGNRVTVNSWFELSLKEGFTNFRDMSFSEDMRSAAVKRISDVSGLRTTQFAEDSGPLAHPIRPHFYQTINNFYTATVYDKGSEVIRMLRTLCGREGFRRGTDIYFKRHDGQAITCVHWVKAIHDANPDAFNLEKFSRWYSQAGTPEVTVTSVYNARKKTLTLHMSQFVPPTHKQPHKLPATIPITTGLIGPDGSPVPVDLGDGGEPENERVLVLSEEKQSFIFYNVPAGTLPSLLRNFSAPIKLKYEQGESLESLAFQMGYDTDDFNRWEAGQKLALQIITNSVLATTESFPEVPTIVIDAFRRTLVDESIDFALRAQLFYLPSESYILDQIGSGDPVRIRHARAHLRRALASALERDLWTALDARAPSREYSLDPAAQGARALRNVALSYLTALEGEGALERALAQVRLADNMTDVQAAITALAGTRSSQREAALREFYEKWKHDRLVVDKWMRIQATASREDVLDSVERLMTHEAFDIAIPNCVYALVRSYAYANLHMARDGAGYRFLADQVIRLDAMNPQVAAKVSRVFTRIKKYDEVRQAQMRKELLRIKAVTGLSKDVSEVVENCLEA